ncbi:MAG TPA: hypothetical protein VJB70_04900 [Candidatus Paceibacterota bacterium]
MSGKRLKNYWGIIMGIVFVWLFNASVALAQTSITLKLQNPIQYKNIPELIKAILDVIVQISVPVVALLIIYSGFLYVKAQGNEEELKTAHRALTWTLVGAAVLLGASVLSGVIAGTIAQIQGTPQP